MNLFSEQLIEAAREIRERAYAPYSDFAVGAALLAGDRIFIGCNIENISYGLTICAERVALGSAVAAGCRDLRALVIVSRGGIAPCGACRQVLAEFAPRLQVGLINVDQPGGRREFSLAELLPEAIPPDALGGHADE